MIGLTAPDSRSGHTCTLTAAATAPFSCTEPSIVFHPVVQTIRSELVYKFNWGGAVVAIAVFAGLVWAILKTTSLAKVAPQIPALTVKRIGEVLMTDFVWPLQCVGLLLTAALIGALILVMEEKRQ